MSGDRKPDRGEAAETRKEMQLHNEYIQQRHLLLMQLNLFVEFADRAQLMANPDIGEQYRVLKRQWLEYRIALNNYTTPG